MAACLPWALTATSIAGAQSTGVLLRPVAVTGDPVPGGNGFFNFFQQPSINDQGDVSFSATFSNTFDFAGVLVDRSSGLEVVARTNDPAPDGNGVLFSFATGPVPINSLGQVAFINTLTGSSGGFNDATRIFTADGQLLRQVVSRGQAAPDGNGTFDSFNALGVEDGGDALFWALFANTSGGFSVDDRGFYRGDGITDIGPAPLDEIVRAGELVGGGTGLIAGNLDPLLTASHTSGWVAVAPFVTNSLNPPSDSAVMIVDDGIQSTLAFQLGDASPDGNGTIFDFSIPYVASDGRVATNVTFANSSQGLADNMGIVSYSPTGSDRVLVREGDGLPGGNGESFAVDFVDAAGFASNQLFPNRFVFHGFVNGAGGGTGGDEGLFVAIDTTLVEVAREGDPAPAEPLPGGDGEFALLRLNQVQVNASGTVAFYAQVRNQTTLGDGIFRWSPNLGVDRIARVGQPLLGSTIQAIFFMNDIETRRAGVSPLNAFGEITFRVRLQDGREAIIATNGVPEPTGGALAGLVALASLAARRERRHRGAPDTATC